MSTNTALDQIKNRVEGHTEGPWQIEEGDEAWEVRAPEGSITWDDHGGEVFRNRADAELIAAAPKLLAALEAVEALHVPEAAGAVGAPEQLECSHCIDPHDSAWRVAWPCQTIKAIEEALR